MKFPNDESVTVIGRYNRPGTLTKTYLEVHFTNNGNFVDPYQISAVWAFPKPTSASAGTYLDLTANSANYGLVTEEAEGTYADFKWENSSAFTSSTDFDASAYTGADSQGSRIWKISTGRFGVVLDPDASSVLSGVTTPNQASGIGEYYDIWQVKMTESSDWQSIINSFELFSDSYVTFTEKPDIRVRARIVNNRVNEDSIVNIVIPVEVTVAGYPTMEDKLNLFNRSIIDEAALQIRRAVPNASWIDVSGFSDTSSLVTVDSNDTIRLLVNTEDLKAVTGLGSSVGIYKVRARFTILDETHITDEFNWIVGR